MAVRNHRSRNLVASVIVPAFNGEPTLAKCLDALLSQTAARDSYEVIVVDDGSVDGTRNIAERYPVRYCFQKNQGPAAARNQGASLASGEILLFTDCDCVPAPDWVMEILSPFDDEAVVAAKGAYKTKQTEIVARFAQIEFEERYELLEKTPNIDMVDTYSAGYRKDIFLEMHGFDTGFPKADNEDTDLSYRIASRSLKMVFNPRAIVVHLGHPDTLMRYARLKFSRGYWRMVVYKRFPEKMIRDSYTPQTLKLQIVSLFLLVVAIPILLVAPTLGAALGTVAAVVFFALSLPFILAALRKDVTVGIVSAPLLAVRAASLGLGALWGIAFGRLSARQAA